MRKLKVYQWLGHPFIPKGHPIRKDERFQAYRGQLSCIMAAPSMAAVGRAEGCSPRQLFNLGETWNEHDIAQAMAKPGVVLVSPDGITRNSNYYELKPAG